MWRPFVLVMAVTSAASAQPSDAPTDPAWSEYDEAFDKAAQGRTTDASVQLGALSSKYPGHPAALRAGDLVRSLEPKPRDPNAPSKLARGELIFWSTLSGASLGANICVMADCESERVAAAVFMGTVGGSLAASLLLTRNGVQSGEAQLYNSAQTWGAWNALAINDGFAETRGEAGTSIAMQAGGLAAGIGLWQTWRPTEGDVALTNTFWVWSSLLTVWGHLAVDAEDSLSLRRVVIAGDLGIIAGALASTQLKMSRGRTFLIDVGGVLGTLGGALVAVGTDSEQGAGVGLLLGTGAGLAAGYALTQDWDAPKLPVAPAPIMGPQSVGAGLSSSFSF